jgi:hypothetical protein
MEEPPKKFFRLAPGREVRLRYAYFITCKEVVKDPAKGDCRTSFTYDPATRGGAAPDGRSPKATLHWVSEAHAVDAEIRLYEKRSAKRTLMMRLRVISCSISIPIPENSEFLQGGAITLRGKARRTLSV